MESTQDNRINKTETCSVLLVDARETNAQQFAECLSRMAVDIEVATPFARKLFFDFAHLRKGESIMGCFSQDEWARKYAHRTARALRYWFTDDEEKEQRRVTERDRRENKRLLVPPPEASPAVMAKESDVIALEPTVTLQIAPTIQSAFAKEELIGLEPFKPLEEIQAEIPKPQEPKPSGPSVNENRLQKLQSDLGAERAKIQEFKRLVTLVLDGADNLRFLPNEGKELYDKLMR